MRKPKPLVYERAVAWILSSDVGMSSKAILRHMLGFAVRGEMDPPWDNHDFGRCVRLLKLFPEFKARLNEMGKYHGWRILVRHWDEIEKRHRQKQWFDVGVFALTLESRKRVEAGR